MDNVKRSRAPAKNLDPRTVRQSQTMLRSERGGKRLREDDFILRALHVMGHDTFLQGWFRADQRIDIARAWEANRHAGLADAVGQTVQSDTASHKTLSALDEASREETQPQRQQKALEALEADPFITASIDRDALPVLAVEALAILARDPGDSHPNVNSFIQVSRLMDLFREAAVTHPIGSTAG